MAAGFILPFPASAEQPENMPDFSVLGAVGTLNAAQTKAAAESIYTAIKNHEPIAKLSTDKNSFIPAVTEHRDSLLHIFATVVGGWDAGILTVKNQIHFTKVDRDARLGYYYSGFQIFYLVDDDSYDASYEEMQGKLDFISAQVHDDWTPVEKALFLHDYLAVHYDYDYNESTDPDEEYYRHTAYNLLETGKGVCEAYAWLYNVLLEREGIQSFMMTSDSMLHAWNVVKLDGGWVHVDVTWDDLYQGHAGLVRHDGFLKGHDAFAEAEHTGDDWKLASGLPESEMQITDAYDDGFWSDSIAAVQYYQDGWLMIVPDEKTPNIGWFNHYRYDTDKRTFTGTSLLSLCEYWTVPGRLSYYPATYIVPAVYQGTVFYCTPTSIMKLEDGKSEWFYDLPEEQAKKYRIYGMYIEGDTLYYELSASCAEDPVEYSISLKSVDIAEPTESTAESTKPASTTTSVTTVAMTTATTSTTRATTASTTEETSTAKATTVTTETTSTSTSASTATTTTTTSATTTTTTAATAKTTSSTGVMTTTVSTTASTVTTEPHKTSGDLDGDGAISVSDLVMLKRYLLGHLRIPKDSLACVDLYPDGVIDAYDLAFMKRALLAEE